MRFALFSIVIATAFGCASQPEAMEQDVYDAKAEAKFHKHLQARANAESILKDSQPDDRNPAGRHGWEPSDEETATRYLNIALFDERDRTVAANAFPMEPASPNAYVMSDGMIVGGGTLYDSHSHGLDHQGVPFVKHFSLATASWYRGGVLLDVAYSFGHESSSVRLDAAIPVLWRNSEEQTFILDHGYYLRIRISDDPDPAPHHEE